MWFFSLFLTQANWPMIETRQTLPNLAKPDHSYEIYYVLKNKWTYIFKNSVLGLRAKKFLCPELTNLQLNLYGKLVKVNNSGEKNLLEQLEYCKVP
jgi:hypothetical protein